MKLLDELLNAMHDAFRPGIFREWAGQGISADDCGCIALTLRAFYGEVLQTQSKGQWRPSEWQGKRVVTLALTAKASVTPLDKVAKHFANGKQDSIWRFHSFTRLMARAANRANRMSPEERGELLARVEAERKQRETKPNLPPRVN